jgi:hypothetical protein
VDASIYFAPQLNVVLSAFYFRETFSMITDYGVFVIHSARRMLNLTPYLPYAKVALIMPSRSGRLFAKGTLHLHAANAMPAAMMIYKYHPSRLCSK